ncbi:MAG: LysM peptidoglycan-binding domain-containing protein [Anaerolineae bacterium]|nr:LysM peptidoglycan-binding domain-containing protein [Anaerolineae bacterium]
MFADGITTSSDRVPTPDPTRSIVAENTAREYVVKAGDTLSGIAAANQVSLATLLSVNPLADPNLLVVGQVIRLPEPPSTESSSFKLLPDSRLVRGPDSRLFDVRNFINQQPGYIRLATDLVDGDLLNAADVVERVSLEFSVDARILLALLEYRARWLSSINPDEETRLHPLGAGPNASGVERDGLYRQLTWAADQLNAGYYGWKYRDLTTLEFENGERLRFAAGLNAATVAVQYMLSQFNDYAAWWGDISPDGLYRTYHQYFGDPFPGAIEPLVPSGMPQPPLALPFSEAEVWFYTGGPHGGWGSGSAWSAIDFAPPDDLTDVDSACYISQHWATAVAAGVIARTAVGVVVLDLDGDGDEATGWSILYLHVAAEGRIASGTQVNPGDRIGRPSCQGGFSNGTHLHVARRYNGEWIPADCSGCRVEQAAAPFVLGGWQVVGLAGQEYQGFLVRGPDQRVAEQGRLTPDNLVTW